MNFVGIFNKKHYKINYTTKTKVRKSPSANIRVKISGNPRKCMQSVFVTNFEKILDASV